MQYELRNISYVTLTDGTIPNTADQRINILTGIVGDTYGFTRKDPLTVTFDKSLTGEQIEAEITSAAQAFIVATYPNTW